MRIIDTLNRRTISYPVYSLFFPGTQRQIDATAGTSFSARLERKRSTARSMGNERHGFSCVQLCLIDPFLCILFVFQYIPGNRLTVTTVLGGRFMDCAFISLPIKPDNFFIFC